MDAGSLEQSIEKLLATRGCTFIDGTNPVSCKCFSFTVNSDATFSNITITNTSGSTSDYSGLDAKTLFAGMYFSAPYLNDEPAYFSSITLTSGSLIGSNI